MAPSSSWTAAGPPSGVGGLPSRTCPPCCEDGDSRGSRAPSRGASSRWASSGRCSLRWWSRRDEFRLTPCDPHAASIVASARASRPSEDAISRLPHLSLFALPRPRRGGGRPLSRGAGGSRVEGVRHLLSS